MSQPPPGWQPERHLSPELQPAEAVAAPALAATQFTAYDASPSAAVPGQFAQAPAPGVGQFAQAPTPVYAGAGPRTLTQRNSTTFTAVVVVALYMVLAATTGIVLIGIFPAMLAFRALQRREPLAMLAVAAAAVAIVVSLTVLTRH
jgi:hypothetical protein